MDPQQSAIDALSEPATHGGAAVKRIDTHAAIVFLAGDRAYKIKRAVKLPYLDFSTLELRRSFCEREVALNRRTAPDLYLGVKAITQDADGAFRLGGSGRPIEWVVVMRRFSQDDMLDALAARGALSPALLNDLADGVAVFHAKAEPIITPGDHGGGAAGLRWVIDDNFAELAERPDLFPKPDLDSIERASRAAFRTREVLLDRRLAEGLVRRCHGDLHLRNICVMNGRPAPFDGIEFNDRLSVIDLFYDLAFLLMDLEQRKLRPAANLVLARYLQRRDDLEGLAALPLFLNTRALVRAKVASTAERVTTEVAARQRHRNESLAYFREAARYLAGGPPRLLAIGGLSGSGKSALALRLAPSLGRSPGAIVIRSDIERKAMYGIDETARLPSDAYAPEVGERVFARMLARARRVLYTGHSAILDGVYARPDQRAAAETLAHAAGAGFLGLWLEAPRETLLARVAARRNDASDATADVVEKQLDYDLGVIGWTQIYAGGTLDQVETLARDAGRHFWSKDGAPVSASR